MVDKLNSEGLEFGLEGGVNWSNISNLDADKSLSTFNLGFYFDFKLKNHEAILSYQYDNVFFYYKISNINEKEIVAYPTIKN